MIARHRRGRVWAPALTLAVAGFVLSACGSDDGGVVGATAPPPPSLSIDADAADAADGTEPAAPADATNVPVPAPAPDGPIDACAALPSLEEISAVMGTVLSSTTPLERGPAAGLCEAGGAADGVAYVQFSRAAGTTREQTEALAAELGYPVTDLGDPALPGGFTYASAAAVNVDGTEYLVQTIGLDTMGDPNSPVATARSAQLLVLWLANLEITPLS